jgi:hypothetical protein
VNSNSLEEWQIERHLQARTAVLVDFEAPVNFLSADNVESGSMAANAL